MGDIVVLLVLSLTVGWAVRKLRRQKKGGCCGNCCGCSGGCGSRQQL